jgi:glycosyltransferase involved in cell wall biosynthesis
LVLGHTSPLADDYGKGNITMRDEPTVSVVIPTYNRKASLRRTLDALCAQTYPLQQVEIIVVTDGCTDGTAEILSHYEAPFTLRVIEQLNQGPSAARNQGAAQAKGQFLIFLDDDIESAPSLIEAHVRAHACQSGRVVIGYLPPVIQEPVDFFRIELRGWWEAMFQPMRQPGHRYGYWNLLSGNLSLEAELFACVGGFDPTLRCHEDYEFGVRLIKAGASLTFAADALGYHHEASDLNRSLQRKYQEGRVDVIIGRRYPELRPSMPLAHFWEPWSSLSRRLRHLAFAWPAGGDRLAASLQRTLDLLEWMRLRGRWSRLLYELLDYWYWRGAAEELSTQRALADFLRGGPARADEDAHEIELDLREGLEKAERRLDEERPAGACIRYGQWPVGRIPPQPGAERLRGVHLRPILATDLAWPLLRAMALEGVTGKALDTDQLFAEFSIQSLENVYANENTRS